jgi:hypothetical protein
MPDKLPGKGLFGWLGRQFGYVSKAVKADVTAKPQAADVQATADEQVVYRKDEVQELPHPTAPNLKLRRTVVDEVIRSDAVDEESRPK